MKITVSRPFDGVTLNGEREYLLNDDQTPMRFNDVASAKEFLRERGVDDDYMEILEFHQEQ